MNAEQARLKESRERAKHGKRWGTYVSERAWGTVRGDYSAEVAAELSKCLSRIFLPDENGARPALKNSKKIKPTNTGANCTYFTSILTATRARV